jgi:hypothetical protein
VGGGGHKSFATKSRAHAVEGQCHTLRLQTTKEEPRRIMGQPRMVRKNLKFFRYPTEKRKNCDKRCPKTEKFSRSINYD